MSSQISKLWHDLWSDKSRTIQVVLVIALGAIAIGLVIGGRNLIAGTIADQWKQAEPPNIKLAVNPPLTDDQLQRIERIDGVYQAEGTLSGSVEWRFPGEGEWQTARLEARQDYQDQKMELVNLESGAWPNRSTLGVIKTADTLYGVGEGSEIEVRSNDQVRRVRLTGTLKPVGPFPVVFLGEPVFYADQNFFSRLTGRNDYDTILTRDLEFNRAQAEATDLLIQDYFDDLGVDSVGTLFPFQDRIISPDVPPAAGILNALFLILGVIGVIVIILGVFLVYTTINAIITQQTDQIGVMKAIGARSRQVFFGYFFLILAFGLLATIVAIPIGGLGARGLQGLFINLLNLEDPGFTFDYSAVAVQVAVSMLVPVLAAVFPLLSGVRISVREAISTYGLTGGAGLIERLLARVRRLPYSVLLVLSNAFRNRRRVFFIEITLVLAGVIFMMVIGVNDATRFTFGDKLTSIHNYQVSLQFEEPTRIQRIEGLAGSYPGVDETESWLLSSGKARPVSQEESEVTDARIRIFGMPENSQMYIPDLQSGRWLVPGDGKALVLSQKLATEKNWEVGDQITLTDNAGQEHDWQVVGITFDPINSTTVFVPLAELQRELGLAGQANTLWAQTSVLEGEQLAALASGLSETFTARGFDLVPSSVFGYSTITEIVEQTTGGFSIILQLLAIMAVIIAIVGGVGLSGALSLNVLERRREIGVMRSVGASTWRVIRLFVTEGIMLGWLSWFIALPLSIPAAYFLTTRGLSFALNQQLVYQFTPAGALVWLFVITILAVLASSFPARGAAKVSVNESLAY
jgi:putative ABC transport system permease protein